MRPLRCHKCGHTWITTSTRRHTGCPSCGTSVPQSRAIPIVWDRDYTGSTATSESPVGTFTVDTYYRSKGPTLSLNVWTGDGICDRVEVVASKFGISRVDLEAAVFDTDQEAQDTYRHHPTPDMQARIGAILDTIGDDQQAARFAVRGDGMIVVSAGIISMVDLVAAVDDMRPEVPVDSQEAYPDVDTDQMP